MSEPIQLDEDQALCLACLGPNKPEIHLCVHCGAPLSSLATYDPVNRLWAEGWIYRRATSEPINFITLIGIWIIFIPAISLFFSPFSERPEVSALYFTPWGFPALLGVAVIYRTTKNYWHHRTAKIKKTSQKTTP